MLSVQIHVNWLLRGCTCKNCRCKNGNQNCGLGCSCTNCSQYKDTSIDIEVEENKVLNSQNPLDQFFNLHDIEDDSESDLSFNSAVTANVFPSSTTTSYKR